MTNNDAATEYLQDKIRELKEERPLKQFDDAIKRRPFSETQPAPTIRTNRKRTVRTDEDDPAQHLANLIKNGGN